MRLIFLIAKTDIESVLKLWRIRILTQHGRIIIFKTFALSKILYLAYLIIFEKEFNNILYANVLVKKIQHETLRMAYRNG